MEDYALDWAPQRKFGFPFSASIAAARDGMFVSPPARCRRARGREPEHLVAPDRDERGGHDRADDEAVRGEAAASQRGDKPGATGEPDDVDDARKTEHPECVRQHEAVVERADCDPGEEHRRDAEREAADAHATPARFDSGKTLTVQSPPMEDDFARSRAPGVVRSADLVLTPRRDGGALRTRSRRPLQNAEPHRDRARAAEAGGSITELVERYADALGESFTFGRGSGAAFPPEVLTPEQLADLLQLDVETVLSLADAGEIPGRRLKNEWRFSRRAVPDWLAAAGQRHN